MTSAITGLPDLAAIIDGIIRRHGTDVLDNRARLHGLLRDHAPGDLRSIRGLMMAHEGGTAERLRSLSRPPSAAELAAETTRLMETPGAEPDLVHAAVETWGRVATGLLAKQVDAPIAAIRPLPLPGGAGLVQPLPGSGSPLPVQALPASDVRPARSLAFRGAIITAIVAATYALARVLGLM